jgi:hypothetical protein
MTNDSFRRTSSETVDRVRRSDREKTSFASIGISTTEIGSAQRAVSVSVRRHPSAELFFAGLVALGEAIRPDPIPNSAVKRLSANGTLSQDTGE